MKMGIAHRIKSLLVAGSLLLASGAQAYYTNYLDAVSNTLTFVHGILTNDPSPDASERRQIALISRALRTLSLPSTTVAGDYKLFVKAAMQLGPLAEDPMFLELGTNVFDAFTNEAQVQIIAAGDRIAALNDFVRVKRGASNQVRQAQATLDRIPTLTDIRLALVVGRQVFNKINVANRLAAIGEAKPGFALDSVAGTSLTHTNNSGGFGVVTFTDATNYTEVDDGSEMGAGTYTYTRTGLNTATLVLTGITPEEFVVTVKLVFTGANRGKATAREAGSSGTSSATFTISP